MKKKNNVTGSIIGLLSSILAFLGMISCCGFPLIAAFLAWFGIGASQLNFLSEYQSLFSIIAIIALLYGFYTIYFKNAKTNNSSDCCDTTPADESAAPSCGSRSKTSNGLAKGMLWVAAVAVVASFAIKKDVNSIEGTVPSCQPTSVNTPACSPNNTPSQAVIPPQKQSSSCSIE